MSVSKVGRRGQITIPRDIRRKLKLQEGDRVAFLEKGPDIVLEPISVTLLDLRGSVPVDGEQDFAAIRKKVMAEHATKVARDEE